MIHAIAMLTGLALAALKAPFAMPWLDRKNWTLEVFQV